MKFYIKSNQPIENKTVPQLWEAEAVIEKFGNEEARRIEVDDIHCRHRPSCYLKNHVSGISHSDLFRVEAQNVMQIILKFHCNREEADEHFQADILQE